jgi:hypothetical protein
MSKILLDYFFPITSIEPTPQVATGFLKQACLVVKPKGMVATGSITLCTTMTAVAALTDNTEAQQLFNAGMNKVYILPMDDLDLADALDGRGEFFTVLISSDFSKDDVGTLVAVAEVKSKRKIQDIMYTSKLTGTAGDAITIIYTSGGTAGSEAVSVISNAITVQIENGVSTTTQIKAAIVANSTANGKVGLAIDVGDEANAQAAFSPAKALQGGVDEIAITGGLEVGTFKGVVGVSETDDAWLAAFGTASKRAAFHTTSGNKAKNMLYAFGKMLSNALNWRNQQYITMPYADDVATLGAANNLFDNKVNFVISDDEFGNRLGLFAAGAKAIVAPYILRNLELDFQSAALSFISGNQPAYSLKQAALLEDELQKVIQSYIDREWITAGTAEVKLENDNFVASGFINVAEPKAMWRIFAEMRQTL